MNLKLLGLTLSLFMSVSGATDIKIDELINENTLSNGLKAPVIQESQKSWATNVADELFQNGQLQDENYDKDSLNEEISRIEFAKIAVDSLDLPDLTDEDRLKYDLSDIELDSPDYDIAVRAIKAGIINGVGTDDNGKIIVAPDKTITREQMAKISDKSFSGDKKEETINANEVLKTKPDGEKVAEWAKEPMAKLVAEGIVKGDENGNINPQANIKRGEAYAMFNRFAKNRNAMVMIDTQDYINYKKDIMQAKADMIEAHKAGKIDIVAKKQAFIDEKKANYDKMSADKIKYIEAKREFANLRKEYINNTNFHMSDLETKKSEISNRIANKQAMIQNRIANKQAFLESKRDFIMQKRQMNMNNISGIYENDKVYQGKQGGGMSYEQKQEMIKQKQEMIQQKKNAYSHNNVGHGSRH